MSKPSYHWVEDAQGNRTLITDHPNFNHRLQQTLQHLTSNSPFYRMLLEQKGFTPPFNKPLDPFLALPATQKEEYCQILQAEALDRMDQRNHIICDHSSGSTACCVLRISTPGDELAEQALTEQVFQRVGMGPQDHFTCMEVGVPEIYDFYFRAARNLGVKRTNFLHLTGRFGKSVRPLKELRPTVLLTLPSVLARVWPTVKAFWPTGKSPIRAIIHMGEAIHPALRAEIMEQWGCEIYSFYGTTEVGGIAGECHLGDGCHYDPTATLLTLDKPTQIDPHTLQGEALFTTLHFRSQAVVKYQVGDLLQVTTAPCPCGDPTPRIRFLERTNDSFILTGVKFRYNAIFGALREVESQLTFASLVLDDLPEEEGNTQLTVQLPESFKHHQEAFLETLEYCIYELDAIVRFGLVRIRVEFKSDADFGPRKIRKINDRRAFMTLPKSTAD